MNSSKLGYLAGKTKISILILATSNQLASVQYSTVQYSTVQYSTVQYSTVQYSTVQYTNLCLYLETESINTIEREVYLETESIYTIEREKHQNAYG
jgi:hypothetical protein